MNVGLPVAAGGLALALLVAAGAGAETVAVQDTSENHLNAGLDLVGAQYSNDVGGFSARVTVRNLKDATDTLGFTVSFPAAKQTFQVVLVRKKGGATSGRVVRDQGDGALLTTCASVASTWDNRLDRIELTVPWKCLGKVRAAMRVQGYFGAGRPGSGDPDDFLKTVKVGYR